MHGTFDHRVKNRRKVTRRFVDGLQYFGRRRLLLQRLGKLARALLFSFKKPRVLDGDHRLIGKGGDQLDLLRCKRLDDGA